MGRGSRCCFPRRCRIERVGAPRRHPPFPRPLSRLDIVERPGSGARGRTFLILVFRGAVTRAPPMPSPWLRWVGLSIRASHADLGQARILPIDSANRATVSRDRSGHRRPSSTPGPDRGSRKGDAGNRNRRGAQVSEPSIIRVGYGAMLLNQHRYRGAKQVRGASENGSHAPVSTISKSWVIVAVLAIIAEAEQYFSTESWIARSTLLAARFRPLTT